MLVRLSHTSTKERATSTTWGCVCVYVFVCVCVVCVCVHACLRVRLKEETILCLLGKCDFPLFYTPVSFLHTCFFFIHLFLFYTPVSFLHTCFFFTPVSFLHTCFLWVCKHLFLVGVYTPVSFLHTCFFFTHLFLFYTPVPFFIHLLHRLFTVPQLPFWCFFTHIRSTVFLHYLLFLFYTLGPRALYSIINSWQVPFPVPFLHTPALFYILNFSFNCPIPVSFSHTWLTSSFLCF